MCALTPAICSSSRKPRSASLCCSPLYVRCFASICPQGLSKSCNLAVGPGVYVVFDSFRTWSRFYTQISIQKLKLSSKIRRYLTLHTQYAANPTLFTVCFMLGTMYRFPLHKQVLFHRRLEACLTLTFCNFSRMSWPVSGEGDWKERLNRQVSGWLTRPTMSIFEALTRQQLLGAKRLTQRRTQAGGKVVHWNSNILSIRQVYPSHINTFHAFELKYCAVV